MNLFSEVLFEYCDVFYVFYFFLVFIYVGSCYIYMSVLL